MKRLPVLFLFAVLATSLLEAADFVNGQAARAVVGKYAFTDGNTGPTNQLLGGPSGLAYVNGRLIVADSNRVGGSGDATNPNANFNRVLIFDTSQIPAPNVLVSSLPAYDSFCHLCGYAASVVVGQPDFNSSNAGLSQTGLQTPTAVASDGVMLAVADTDNNRVLLWKTIPTVSNAPADIVLGQADFTSRPSTSVVNAQSLRGPQGVWFQNGKLFVADTQNFRVLIWNTIPTQNNQPADIVLGQPDMNSANQPPVTSASPTTSASQLLNPVSVTSDGVHLFVADLGFNRVLIWDSIPTRNTQPADHVIGQADMTTSAANNVSKVCPEVTGTNSSGTPTDSNGNSIFECAGTLNFPRYALSDGTRLFVADGGNDRVLIFNHIPTTNGAQADIVLGQPDFRSDVVSNQTISIISTAIDNTDSVDTIRTPSSLAFDGTNLYVSDPYGRRVLVYSPGDVLVPQKSIVNAASLNIRQEGFVALSVASVVANDTVTITIGGTNYVYTVKSDDSLTSITQGLVNVINANSGDPNVIASLANSSNPGVVFLNSRSTALDADTISLTASTSNSADLTATASGSYLTGGTAAIVAPGTLIQLNAPSGATFGDSTLSASMTGALPLELGGVEVSIDGFQAPLMMVSPTQIVAQVPFQFSDRSSSSVYVRSTRKDGSVTVTTATTIQIAPANPGLFAITGVGDPRPVNNDNAYTSYAMHQSGNPSATVSIDGSVQANDVATITIAGTAYNYTVVSSDTLATITQNLVNVINNSNNGAGDPFVVASVGGAFTRVVLTAKSQGAAGSGISVAGSASSGASVVVTAYNSATCCSNSSTGDPVTTGNPALPNELVTFYATGLGLVSDSTSTAGNFAVTGLPYNGPQPNSATQSVSATINGETGQVVSAGLAPGGIGIYAVQVLMPSDLPANPVTPIYIAQNAFISNIVTVPVGTTAGGAPFTATPNPIPVGPGNVVGTTTINWNTKASSVEVHISTPRGPLFATGGSSGSAVTGPWVTEGMTFFLVDPSNGSVIGSLVAHLVQSKASFTASPNPIYVSPGTSLGKTTFAWYAASASSVQIRVNSPDGPMMTGGGQTGTATTDTWVTDGMTFYLQDSSNGDPTSPANTLATATVAVKSQPATLVANPNPIPVFPGASSGQTTLTWNAPGASSVALHVGSPTGPVFTGGSSYGSGSTGPWVGDGTTFYLVDSGSGSTLASTTVHLDTKIATFTASPNPIPVGPGVNTGITTFTWSAPYAVAVQIRVGSPGGPMMTTGGSSGSAFTDNWVTDGMVFYLQDATRGDPTSSANTLATVTVRLAH